MSAARGTLAPHAVTAGLLAVFLGFGLRDLGRAPKIYEDEAPIVAPGYRFVTTGVFGTPLDGGFAGSDRHCYEFMPLFSVFVGASVRLFGFGLFQARLVPLAVATLVLLLTHLAGSRLLSPGHGAVAAALLAVAPVSSPLPHLATGIPMVDLARLVRYDAAVALCGLAALLVLAPAFRDESPPGVTRLFAAGVLIGAGTLCHIYGAFWLVALMLTLAVARGRAALRGRWWASLAGFLLVLFPWIIFVASGWHDFLAQSLQYSERFTLLDPRFYAANVRGEIARYGLVIEAARRHLTPWLFVGSAAGGAWVLLRRARRADGGGRAAAVALLGSTTVLVVLLAVLIQPKRVFYLATLWPLFALLASCGLAAAWRSASRPARIAIIAACFLVTGEGLLSLGRFAAETRSVTPYGDFTARLSRLLPVRGRVMGMKHYWIGLAPGFPDYVAVPLPWTHPRFADHPVTFAEAADSLAPRVFLLDQVLLDFLRANVQPDAAFHNLAAAMQGWLSQRGRRIAVLQDPTYGRLEVWAIDTGTPPGS